MQFDEYEIRSIVFLSVFILISLLELIIPRRAVAFNKRQLNNFLIFFVDIITVRVLFPAASVGVAIFANENALGLFNVLKLNGGVEVLLSILVLDFMIYLQHMVFHRVEFLWKFHRVHHSDSEFDFTTALRFHPIEIILSMLIKAVLIITLGCSALSVLIFETILNSMAVFNHGNIKLPKSLDRFLRFFIVTPDMHRIHHSTIYREHNSNYGFNISWWDKIFKTYTHNSKNNQREMSIGLKSFEGKDVVSLISLLKQPFKN